MCQLRLGPPTGPSPNCAPPQAKISQLHPKASPNYTQKFTPNHALEKLIRVILLLNLSFSVNLPKKLTKKNLISGTFCLRFFKILEFALRRLKISALKKRSPLGLRAR